MARNNYKDESWVGWKNDYGVEVIEIIGTENGHTRWYCKCPLNGVDCKGIWPTDAERVAKNKTKSCGCFQATYSLGKYIGYTNDYGSEVIEIMEHRNKHGAVIWRCLCKCGKTFPTTARSFMSGHTKSCGCKKESYEKEKWVGWKNKFGVEVVGISKERTKTDRKSIQWDCICPICGNIFSSPAMNIRFNHTKSCGCLKEKYSSEKYIGRKYGDIGGGIEVIGIGGKDERGNVIWHCKCFCGVEFSELATNIDNFRKKSCGCLSGDNLASDKWLGYKNSYGSEVVEILKDKGKKGETLWRFKCFCSLNSDITHIVRAHRFKIEDVCSCGCLQGESLQSENWLGYENAKGSKVIDISVIDGVTYWSFVCGGCKTIKTVSAFKFKCGDISSCGCLKESNGEAIIKKVLTDNSINFDREFSFDTLKSMKGYKLRYDFSILYDSNVIALIEYDGKQHSNFKAYKSLSKGHATYEDFLEAQGRDKQKDDYAREHNIPLYRIPYTYTPEQIEVRVLEILKDLNLIDGN